MTLPIKKIVLIGPESSGKTTLCQKLAHHYNAIWVEEYARQYLTQLARPYLLQDLDQIALGQLEQEKLAIQKIQKEKITPLLFLDTDMHVMKVWSEFVFNQCSPLILNQLAENSCDLYLLCEPDIEWVKDDLREHEAKDIRQKIYHYYKESMLNQSSQWVTINGDFEARFNKAIKAVDALLNKV